MEYMTTIQAGDKVPHDGRLACSLHRDVMREVHRGTTAPGVCPQQIANLGPGHRAVWILEPRTSFACGDKCRLETTGRIRAPHEGAEGSAAA